MHHDYASTYTYIQCPLLRCANSMHTLVLENIERECGHGEKKERQDWCGTQCMHGA